MLHKCPRGPARRPPCRSAFKPNGHCGRWRTTRRTSTLDGNCVHHLELMPDVRNAVPLLVNSCVSVAGCVPAANVSATQRAGTNTGLAVVKDLITGAGEMCCAGSMRKRCGAKGAGAAEPTASWRTLRAVRALDTKHEPPSFNGQCHTSRVSCVHVTRPLWAPANSKALHTEQELSNSAQLALL